MDFVFKAFFLQFLLFGMLVQVVRPQTVGTDCRGRDYLCLDDVRFQLCVDYGDGQPRTVSDEVQLCPHGTFCSNSGQFECDSFVPPSTTAEPHVGESEPVYSEDGPVSPDEPVVVEEEATLPEEEVEEPVENTETNEPSVATTVGEPTVATDSEAVASEVEVTAATNTDEPVEESTSGVTSDAVEEVPEEHSSVDPETTEAVVEEKTTEEASTQSNEDSESVATDGDDLTTVEPSVEVSSQTENAENTEAPVEPTTVVDAKESDKPTEEEVTLTPEEELNPENVTEVTVEEETDEASSDATAVEANTEEESEAPNHPEEELVPSTEAPEVEPTVGETSSVTEQEESQPEEGDASSDGPEQETNESEVPQTTDVPKEVSSVEPEVTDSTSQQPSETVTEEVTSESTTENVPSTTSSTELSTAPTTPGPFVCQTAGRFAHPTDCHKYYLCFWLPFGLYSLEQNCLVGFAYNPTLERCTADQSVCFPGQFTCTGPGRFPDPADPTHYFWCVWNLFGGYLQYNLQCPLGQVFNPVRARCTFLLAGRSLSFEPADQEDLPVESTEGSTQVDQSDEPTNENDQSVEPVEPVNPLVPEETQPKLKVKFACLEEGTFADPNNCGRYFVCTLKKLDKFKKSKFKCITGERFDALVGACVPDVDALCG